MLLHEYNGLPLTTISRAWKGGSLVAFMCTLTLMHIQTVQTISLIVKMQPRKSRDYFGYAHSGGVPITVDDGIRRTTLILAPASLVQQVRTPWSS